MNPDISVLFVCVNYNSYRQLDNFLLSIQTAYIHYTENSKSKLTVKIVVADNSAESRQIDTDSFPFQVVQYETKNNAGYLGGVMLARAALGLDFSEWTFSVISNVDVCVSAEFFAELVKQVSYDRVGCIAPAIISQQTNSDRNPKLLVRTPKRNLQIMKFLFTFPVLYKLKTKISSGKMRGSGDTERDIYAAHGSFMIFTDAFARFLNSFEFPSFLFCEEIYFAEHLAQAGLHTRYVPSIVISDMDHQSTGKMKLRSYCRMNKDSINMIIKNYYR